MPNLTNPIPEELYVIEVDGIRRSEHQIFVKALKRALELQRQYPRSDVKGAVGELVGIDGGVVSGVINLELSGVEASDWRPRHDERYHEA